MPINEKSLKSTHVKGCKMYQNLFITLRSLWIFLFLFTLLQANPYIEMQKIDRKIYVASTQQKMLGKTLQKERRKAFNGSRIRAYEKAIAKLHGEELQYRAEKKVIQKKIWRKEAREHAREKNLASIPGDIHIYVNRSTQTMKVYKGKVLIYTWLCSTGKKGYRTPSGSYTPYHAVPMHYSRKWNNSPMPYSVFYYKGFAIHGTNYVRNLGRQASHGCIRLQMRHAKKIYHLARKYGYKRIHIRVA